MRAYAPVMTTVRKPRGQYAKTGARRQEILEAAVEVFSSAGFHKGSLRDVADRVGLSQAGLLHHFPSKEALLEAVLAWRDENSQRFLGDPTPKGVALLRGLVDLAEYNQSTPELVQLHVILSAEGTSVDHPIHHYFMTRYAAVLEMIVKAFEHAEAREELMPGVDCDSAARTLIALMDGLQVQWLLHRDEVDMPGDLRRYLEPLLVIAL
jgi:AcrR family transcriptional regulator